jgi:hypothetical protein
MQVAEDFITTTSPRVDVFRQSDAMSIRGDAEASDDGRHLRPTTTSGIRDGARDKTW